MNNAIIKTLTDQRKGECLNEASARLAQLIQAVRATGKGGTFSLKLIVKPASKGNIDVLHVEDDIKVKLPELTRPCSVFFPDDHGTLHRSDPRQSEMELRTVPTVEAPVRQVQAS